MKRKFITSLLLILIPSLVYAADIQRGQTFTANDTVTNTKLHNLVDDATLSNVEQSDIKTNFGLTEKSSTNPSDTDSLWNDTNVNKIKGYTGGSWVEIGTVPTTITTSTITTTGIITAGGNVNVSGDVTANGSLTVDDSIWIGSDEVVTGFGAYETTDASQVGGSTTPLAVSTEYQASIDGIITAGLEGDDDCEVVIYVGTSSGFTKNLSTTRAAMFETDALNDKWYITNAPVSKDEYWYVTTAASGSKTDKVEFKPLT